MARKIFLFDFIIIVMAFDGNMVLKDLGEREYKIIRAKSNLPAHGACWHDALKSLKSSCDRLNDNQHSLMALKLANCFLEDSGHVTYDCFLSESDDHRRECIHSMSDRAFGVYNEFYTHTTYMCFFLNHELWQAETENTIKQLYEASTRMREQLMEASEIQDIVLESQKQGLIIQNELLDHGKELGNVIRSSAETVSSMVVDFRETAKDQKQLLYEIFSYMRTFQNWIQGEVSWIQSIAYYMLACILCALFSSTKRTAEARVSLFTILSLNVIVERMLVQYRDNTKESSPDDELELIHLSWRFRKLALFMCFFTLVYTYYSYNDGNYENYKVLRRIESQLKDLQVEPQPLRYSKRLALRRLNDSRMDETSGSAKSFDPL